MPKMNKVLANARQPLTSAEQDNARRNIGAFSATEVADAYSSSATYNVGDVVIHDSGLYQCTTKITQAEDWNSDHWESVAIVNAIKTYIAKYDLTTEPVTLTNFDDIKAIIDAGKSIVLKYNSLANPNEYFQLASSLNNKIIFSRVSYDGADANPMSCSSVVISKSNGTTTATYTSKVLIDKVYADAIASMIAAEYDSAHTYKIGDLVKHENVLYRCKTANTTGTWNAANWNVATSTDIFSGSGTTGLVPPSTAEDAAKLLSGAGTWVTVDLTDYITEANLGDIVASLYSASSTYTVGAYVIKDKKLYRCTTAITQAENWNAGHWTLAKSTDTFQGSAPGLVPQVPSGAVVRVLSSDGNWSEVEDYTDAYIDELFVDGVVIGGRKYPYVQIGNQLWIIENLDYKFAYEGGTLPIGGSGNPTTPAAWYYNNDEASYGVDGTYKCGLLYNWYAVNYLEANKSTLLPDGWHVPTDDEWSTLITEAGSSSTAGTKLKALDDSIIIDWPTGWNGTDSYGFSALPAGYYNNGSTSLGANARFWTATSSPYDNNSAYRIKLDTASSSNKLNDSKVIGYSLRLVKNLT